MQTHICYVNIPGSAQNMIDTIGLLVSATLTLIPHNLDQKPEKVLTTQQNITTIQSNPSLADFDSSAMTISSWGESEYYINLTPAELIPLPKNENVSKSTEKDKLSQKSGSLIMQMASSVAQKSPDQIENSSTPAATLNPSPTVSVNVDSSPHPLDANILKVLINAHRVQKGLPEYQEDQSLCQIADQRLPQLAEEILGPKAMHAGLAAMDLPINVTENLIHMATEDKAFTWWLNSPVHRRSIESPTYTHTCGRCIGNSCVQIFSNLSPKRQIQPQI